MLNSVILVGEIQSISKPKLTASNHEVVEVWLRTWDRRNGKLFNSVHIINFWSRSIKDFLSSIKVGDVIDVRGQLYYVGRNAVINCERAKKVDLPILEGKNRKLFEE